MLQSVFLQILNMHKTAAVVIPVILLMRLLLKKAPKKWSYLLWSVVGFRLICPVSFEAAFSLFNLRSPVTPSPSPGGSYAVPGPTAVYPPQQVLPPTYNHSTDAYIPAPVPAADPWEIGLRIASVVWIIGIAALFVYSIISYVNIKKQMTTAIHLENNIWQSDRVRSPFILGFVRPKIFIPFGLDEDARRYVLAHERCHLRHRDHWVKPLAFLLLAVHWFDPLVWLSFHLMSKDMEMRTDEEVLAQTNGSRKTYSITLLSFAANRRFPTPSPLAFGECGVKSRIKNALHWKRPKLWTTILAVVIAVSVIASCAADPTDDTPDPTCMVTVNEASIAAQYYEDGFDYDYDKLMSLTPVGAETYLLTFDISWETNQLTVSEGYYKSNGDVTQVSHTLNRNADGRFTLEVPAPQVDLECAAYFVFADTGVFVTKIYFQPYRPWNVQLTAEHITRTGATIRLQNYTAKDGTPQTGERFWLEQMDGTNWIPVDAEADAGAGWDMIAYQIGAEPLTLECDWSGLYGSLPDGIYRLCKEISNGGETMNCYVLFSFPTHLQLEPTCEVTVNELDVAPSVRWFPEGFDFDYDKLTPLTLPYQEHYELVFRPSWNCEVLEIGQDFYTRRGSAATAYCESFDIPKEADGTFRFEVSRMNTDEAEHAVYYIPYLDGKFVFQLEFAPQESEPADLLEAAIHAAILDHGRSAHSEPYFCCESHVTLAHLISDGLKDDDTDWRGQDILYLMALYQEYEITENGLTNQAGSHMPTRLTFDRYSDGTFELAEYWTPKDGTLYEPSIQENFPEFIWEDAMDTQKYILPQIQSCYAQAVAYARLDPEPILDALFDEIASSPARSSNPGDYLDAHPLEVRELTYYGDYTLDYIFRRFLEGGQIGLHGHLMRHVMDLLIGEEAIEANSLTGQDYFNQWRTHVIQLSQTHSESWMQENTPKGSLLLQILDQS